MGLKPNTKGGFILYHWLYDPTLVYYKSWILKLEDVHNSDTYTFDNA